MIILKTPREVELMRESGKRLARVLETLKNEVKPGIKTKDINRLAEELIRKEGGIPAFLNYRPGGASKPFPASVCVSINETVVHGLPSEYEIREGDLVKVDIGLIYKDFYSDMAITLPVGKVSPEDEKLIVATREALEAAVAAAQAGNTFGDIGAAVEERITEDGFSVVRDLVGHGIGKSLHEDPYVFNFGKPGKGPELKEGMVLAIEPMVAAKSGKVRQLDDDSFVTADGSRAAHFEHTVAITKNGPRILTVL